MLLWFYEVSVSLERGACVGLALAFGAILIGVVRCTIGGRDRDRGPVVGDGEGNNVKSELKSEI